MLYTSTRVIVSSPSLLFFFVVATPPRPLVLSRRASRSPARPLVLNRRARRAVTGCRLSRGARRRAARLSRQRVASMNSKFPRRPPTPAPSEQGSQEGDETVPAKESWCAGGMAAEAEHGGEVVDKEDGLEDITSCSFHSLVIHGCVRTVAVCYRTFSV